MRLEPSIQGSSLRLSPFAFRLQNGEPPRGSVVVPTSTAEGGPMQVSEVMTPGVQFIHPEQTIRESARIMAENDIGALPVGVNDRLVGMVTDRDMVIRGLAEDKGPETKVRDVMTEDVKYCYEDEKVDHVAHNMGEIQVRRLPVMDRDKRL